MFASLIPFIDDTVKHASLHGAFNKLDIKSLSVFLFWQNLEEQLLVF